MLRSRACARGLIGSGARRSTLGAKGSGWGGAEVVFAGGAEIAAGAGAASYCVRELKCEEPESGEYKCVDNEAGPDRTERDDAFDSNGADAVGLNAI